MAYHRRRRFTGRRRFRRAVKKATLLHKGVKWHSTILDGNLRVEQKQSKYIVTAPSVANTQNYVLPTWQVIRAGDPHNPNPLGINEYQERTHLRYNPLIHINTLSLHFRLTWRRSFSICVMCFTQETSPNPLFNMYTRSVETVNPVPPPAPNLVPILPASTELTRSLLLAPNGPLLYDIVEHEDSTWLGHLPKNRRHDRHVLYDSGPRRVTTSRHGGLKERTFRWKCHPHQYVTYEAHANNEQNPIRPNVRQAPVWWVGFYHPLFDPSEDTYGQQRTLPDGNLYDQGADDGIADDPTDAPRGALIKIDRFRGECKWSESPF